MREPLVNLRALAVSAPHWPRRPADTPIKSFTADDPFSLQNAMRYAAGVADKRIGAWGDSNWTTFEDRREAVLLYQFYDESIDDFCEKLESIRPNLLLIGAMSLSLPGAIGFAKEARRALGNECLIVLGGKHCNETILKKGRLDISPVDLMASGKIESDDGTPLFDVVVSGQGEDIVYHLGEAVHREITFGNSPRNVASQIEQLAPARGNWIACTVEDGKVISIESTGLPLDFTEIPTAPGIFGVTSRFPIFDEALTGHAFSDMGLGCRYNCHFCSERSGINGKLNRLPGVVGRLLEHFSDIWLDAGEGQEGEVGVFVEDSILLGGDEKLIQLFLEELRNLRSKGVKLRVGCQLTVNDILKLDRLGLLSQFPDLGIEYVAFGMETVNELIAQKMSKHRGGVIWTEQSRLALFALTEASIRVGVFILWGLGEGRGERRTQLATLIRWKSETGEPSAVGLNWATIHPASHTESDPVTEDFIEWGTAPESENLPFLVRLFGEASENYRLGSSDTPGINELRRLEKFYDQLLVTEKTRET